MTSNGVFTIDARLTSCLRAPDSLVRERASARAYNGMISSTPSPDLWCIIHCSQSACSMPTWYLQDISHNSVTPDHRRSPKFG